LKESGDAIQKAGVGEIPPNQKLRMLQNAVSDVADMSNVKQRRDQVVAREGAQRLKLHLILGNECVRCQFYSR
jgi:hypothetical protein